ncbi:hypothetical protein [Neobacillus sp. SAB-20_R2A]|uniref:hypothetical protein n=1 Tax=Neobacillus sp. SAB-20_R2A TaxID=3120519 RepID=UPI003C6E1CB0
MKNCYLLSLIILFLFFLTACSSNDIEYRDRKYLGPPNEYTSEEIQDKIGDELESKGEKLDGMDGMKPKSVDENGNIPTLLILKKNKDKYIVYSLSGGP